MDPKFVAGVIRFSTRRKSPVAGPSGEPCTFYLISSTKVFMNCPTGMSTDKFAFTKIRIASKNSV